MGLKKRELIQSFWKDRYHDLWCFLCPLCKVPRRIPFRPQPGGFKQTFQVVLTSLIFTLVFWPWFKWKGIVSLVPFWTFFELFYRIRLRTKLVCSQCGFDPYLFRIDLQWARREIDSHWRKKFSEKGIPYPEKPIQPKRQKETQLSP